ncbi:unnamed protein product [Toxocara canis]|uniref:Uncharacterized protein n=1 Tax=Toxocara canis TaxID=6265 RepID=A0A183VCC8_TOXCA|nr:unnamed protein product [Toxocara canis]
MIRVSFAAGMIRTRLASVLALKTGQGDPYIGLPCYKYSSPLYLLLAQIFAAVYRLLFAVFAARGGLI